MIIPIICVNINTLGDGVGFTVVFLRYSAAIFRILARVAVACFNPFLAATVLRRQFFKPLFFLNPYCSAVLCSALQ